jgi:hypothetical protein
VVRFIVTISRAAAAARGELFNTIMVFFLLMRLRGK